MTIKIKLKPHSVLKKIRRAAPGENPGSPADRSLPVIAMAASVGGLKALSVILGNLPADFPAAITIVMHLSPKHRSHLAEILRCRTHLKVKQACAGDLLCRGSVFVAPANHHLSVTKSGSLGISSAFSKKIHHVRPSADPLFASVAEVYQQNAIAVVLTGGDGDGSFGVRIIREWGGTVIVQDGPTSEDFSMPRASIATGEVDFILPLNKIAPKLIELVADRAQGKTDPPGASRGNKRRAAVQSAQKLLSLAMEKSSQKSFARRKTKDPAIQGENGLVAPLALSYFPIIGVGASAGGLEALELFLSWVPRNSGLSFVIVQHLDPTRKGIMPELLQRGTEMKVIQVRDRIKVEPNGVYVIPPNKDMSILHGVLHLLAPVSPRGLRLPIDFFLRSLAQDQQERSIGVILSGMGSDGTLGLRAIKEKAGLVLVQDPATAKFNGMPRSAIDAGLADIVAPAAELPGRIIAYLKRPPLVKSTESSLEHKTQSALEKVIVLLRARTAHDFSLYKKNPFYRRIERRMGIHQIDKISAYIRYLQENSQELDLLFKELLIGVTSFFRDTSAWEQLRKEVIPGLTVDRPAGDTLRAWVAGCSTGEEAYSLAMVFRETMEKRKSAKNFTLNVFATDLDKDAIDKARAGIYPPNIVADVSPERLNRFFTKVDGGYRVVGEIREMVVFAQHSLVRDPPFTKLDILSCRNLLIYLDPEMQKKLIPLFHYSLRPGGVLFLGSAETPGAFTDLFEVIGAKTRLYRRTENDVSTELVDFPASFARPLPLRTEVRPETNSLHNFQSLADRLILDHYSSPAILANDRGNILYVSGRTGNYLEPAAGKANWNIFAMARAGLRYQLAEAFQKALNHKGPVFQKGVRIDGGHGGHFANITVQRLEEPAPLRGLMMIIFADASAPPETKAPGLSRKGARGNDRVVELEHKNLQLSQELQTTREEMQTSQEELRSTNEEMQSTNEELQSSNEEITTSKEEMQSLNEELQTVNAELQVRVDELSRSNNDMKNLLNSTDIATLFLDNHLKIRRFTTEATKIIKLIPGDVGRPVTDLASDLLYPGLTADAANVLQKLGVVEKSITTRDGRWFAVRVMPYRTLDDRIDGVVMTFTNITASKQLEAQLREKHLALETLIKKKTLQKPLLSRPPREKRIAQKVTPAPAKAAVAKK